MHPKVSADEIIRFGEFELALKSGELRKNGSVVRLQPQPFKVLVFLASHAGQTVTRQELQDAVWEEGTFVDFEHGLNFCIKQIRTALGDDAQSPRLVETLPRRGYRFIGEVENNNESTGGELIVTDPQPKTLPGDAQPRAVRPPSRLVIGGAIAVLAILVGGYLGLRSLNKVAVPLSKTMIAVLPFENLSGEALQDYFSDGMTEEMIAQLGRLHPQSLGVIARTSAMTYKGVNKDIARIGSELNVDFVLEGSVRSESDRVRITAQLIQVSDQTHLWSESYDRPSGDVLKVQSEVAGQIANSLAIRLLPEKGSASSHSESPEAVDAYLRGRYLWNKGDREGLSRSVDYFQQAIEKDANYSAAFAGLADSYRLLGMRYAMLPAEAYPKAREAAVRAIELDSTNANAYVSLGSIKFRYEWRQEEAERDFLRAIEINPSLGLAHHDYAWFLIAMKRFDEGIDHMKLAQRLDPLSPLANSDVGWAYLMARRYDEAIEQIKRTLELEPTFGSALACLERAYSLKGETRLALETLLRETGQDTASVGEGDAAQMMRRLFRKRLDKRLAALKSAPSSPYNAATVCVAAGEQEQALGFLEKAYDERDPMLVAMGTDPAFDDLRQHPRFVALQKRLGFPK